ncbi:MAG: creatininase family protein [Candidatus Bathyarchaeia archaeon]
MKTLLSKLTRPEVEEYLEENDLILFPVGSLEQHGKHLAMDNDAFSAMEIAKRVAEKTGVLVAPVMPFGYSKHHMNFAGTITLKSQTLVDVYKQVCKSLIQHGFKKIVIMNGHGGNTNWISQAIREILKETGVRVYSLMIFNSEGGFGSEALDDITQEGGGHACEMETSFSTYLGQRALMDQAEDWREPKSWTEFTRKYKDKVSTARDFHEYTEIGSLGESTKATKEKGEKLVKAVIKDISNFVMDLKNMKGAPAFYSNTKIS